MWQTFLKHIKEGKRWDSVWVYLCKHVQTQAKQEINTKVCGLNTMKQRRWGQEGSSQMDGSQSPEDKNFLIEMQWTSRLEGSNQSQIKTH